MGTAREEVDMVYEKTFIAQPRTVKGFGYFFKTSIDLH